MRASANFDPAGSGTKVTNLLRGTKAPLTQRFVTIRRMDCDPTAGDGIWPATETDGRREVEVRSRGVYKQGRAPWFASPKVLFYFTIGPPLPFLHALHAFHISSQHTPRASMPPAAVNFLTAAAGDRGVKRKSSTMNQDSELGSRRITADAATGSGKESAVDEKRRRKLERRLMKEKIERELRELQTKTAVIDERKQQLLSMGLTSASESAGDRFKHRSEENGSRLRSALPHVMQEESGFGETAQSEPQKFKQIQQVQSSLLAKSSSVNGKRMPKANPAYANDDFVSGTDKFPLPEKPKPKVSGLKRPAPPRSVEEKTVKRQRVEEAREKRMAGIFRDLLSLVKRVLNQKMAWVFAKPVDPVVLNLPDYFTVIKKPMDLGTVKYRLEKSQYSHPLDAVSDVRLTFSNALRYNPPGNDVNFMAKSMLELFEKGYSKVEARLRHEELKVQQEERDLGNEDDFFEDGVDLADRRAVESHIGGRRLSVGRQGSFHQRPGRDEKEKRDMTLEEKRKLGMNLGKLPGDKLGTVVQIISKHSAPDVNQSGDEIELDIDALNSETLWELERFVSNTMKSKHKGKKKGRGSVPNAQVAQTGTDHAGDEKGDVEDNVDIGGDAPAPPGPVGEKARGGKSSSSGGSSSDESGSSSSGSESGSESGSGSEDEADEVQSRDAGHRKELGKSGAALERKNKLSASASAEGAKSLSPKVNGGGEAAGVVEERGSGGVALRTEDVAVGEEKVVEKTDMHSMVLIDELAIPGPRVLRSVADLRAALLRAKYAISILNAKTRGGARGGNETLDPEEQAEMEMKRKEELEKLETEAKLAEGEMKLHEAKGLEEERKKREEKRAAARELVKNMAKTVDVDDSADVLQRLGKLGSDTGNRGYQPSHFEGRQSQSLPPFDVETLGLLRKHDETDDEEDKEEEEEEDEEGEIVVGNVADEGEVLAGSGGEEGGESEPDK